MKVKLATNCKKTGNIDDGNYLLQNRMYATISKEVCRHVVLKAWRTFGSNCYYKRNIDLPLWLGADLRQWQSGRFLQIKRFQLQKLARKVFTSTCKITAMTTSYWLHFKKLIKLVLNWLYSPGLLPSDFQNLRKF